MAVMIPVYILNALYLAPITLWTYLKYGRPEKPGQNMKAMEMGSEEKPEVPSVPHENHTISGHEHMQMKMEEESHDANEHNHAQMKTDGESHEGNDQMGNHGDHHHMNQGAGEAHMDHSQHAGHTMSEMNHMHHDMEAANRPGETHMGIHEDQKTEESHEMSHTNHATMNHGGMKHGAMHDMHMPSADQPMFATVTIAVCHCGAGCLLGDIVGEWLVFGTNATLGSLSIGPEFLIDYAFALTFGIVFQYFSIAPMSGDYGPHTLWRAAKADFLSLTFFEIGLFGWMAIFQFAIFGQRLGMDNVVYWWMMQIGMFFGHWTAFPINWWLITTKVKERMA